MVDQGHYDTGAAKTLLLHPGCLTQTPSCTERLSGDGPFLVTTLIPLSGNHPPSVLIQDLHGTTPDKAGDWVGEFLESVSDQRNWRAGGTLQLVLQNLSLKFDRYGQTMFLVGTARSQVLAMLTGHRIR